MTDGPPLVPRSFLLFQHVGVNLLELRALPLHLFYGKVVNEEKVGSLEVPVRVAMKHELQRVGAAIADQAVIAAHAADFGRTFQSLAGIAPNKPLSPNLETTKMARSSS